MRTKKALSTNILLKKALSIFYAVGVTDVRLGLCQISLSILRNFSFLQFFLNFRTDVVPIFVP